MEPKFSIAKLHCEHIGWKWLEYIFGTTNVPWTWVTLNNFHLVINKHIDIYIIFGKVYAIYHKVRYWECYTFFVDTSKDLRSSNGFFVLSGVMNVDWPMWSVPGCASFRLTTFLNNKIGNSFFESCFSMESNSTANDGNKYNCIVTKHVSSFCFFFTS